MMNKAIFSLSLLLLLTISACSDPYERAVPTEYFTPGEADRIADSLAPPDRQEFLKWSQRMRTNDRFPGETTPQNIREAILSQNKFDAFDVDRQRRISAANVEAAKAQEQENLRQELEQRRLLANQEISKILSVEVTNYNKAPIWAVTGEQIGWKWVFNLRLKNKGKTAITAFKGSLKISDTFNKYQSTMSGQVDISIPPGKTVNYAVTFPNNDDSPLHNLMGRGQQIEYSWVIDSVAFADGTTFDYLSSVQ